MGTIFLAPKCRLNTPRVGLASLAQLHVVCKYVFDCLWENNAKNRMLNALVEIRSPNERVLKKR